MRRLLWLAATSAALVGGQTAPPFCGAEALEAALLLLAHLHGAQPAGIAKELQAQPVAATARARVAPSPRQRVASTARVTPSPRQRVD